MVSSKQSMVSKVNRMNRLMKESKSCRKKSTIWSSRRSGWPMSSKWRGTSAELWISNGDVSFWKFKKCVPSSKQSKLTLTRQHHPSLLVTLKWLKPSSVRSHLPQCIQLQRLTRQRWCSVSSSHPSSKLSTLQAKIQYLTMMLLSWPRILWCRLWAWKAWQIQLKVLFQPPKLSNFACKKWIGASRPSPQAQASRLLSWTSPIRLTSIGVLVTLLEKALEKSLLFISQIINLSLRVVSNSISNMLSNTKLTPSRTSRITRWARPRKWAWSLLVTGLRPT